ncbi:MAG: gluconokinase [Acidobacteria bacterium]|nr:gluconokinase [Acidobacteriota bacterium]
MDSSPRAVVVIGVSGSGKTTVGRVLAERLGADFADADDFHSSANIAKMRSGHPLTDEDRTPWLHAVGQRLADSLADGRSVVMACSALRVRYRDILREYAPGAFFLLLDADRRVLRERVAARQGSFMPASLLDSQIATLEPLRVGEVGVRLDVAGPLEVTVSGALAALDSPPPSVGTTSP